MVVAVVACGKHGAKPAPAAGSGSQAPAVHDAASAVVASSVDALPPDAVPADAAIDAAPADAMKSKKDLDYEHILDWETIGPLKLGLDEKIVIAHFHEPKRKGFPEEEGATGGFVSTWEWPDQGLTIEMYSDRRSGPFHVRSIEIAAPSKLTTSRGLKVGTTIGELRDLYMQNVDEGRDDPKEYLVGSVYGGMLVTHDDHFVTSIFIGPMAF